MNARTITAHLITTSISPLLRHAGFRKSGFSFHRHLGEIAQVLNLQLSQSNRGQHARFYINLGLNFDRVCLLEARPINPKPKHYECQFRRRLEEIIDTIPACWEFKTETESHLLAKPLRSACERLVIILNNLDTIEHFLSLNWLQEGTDLGLRAQLHYILGEQDDAIQALRQEQAFFQTRPNWSVEHWLEQRGLRALSTHLIARTEL